MVRVRKISTLFITATVASVCYYIVSNNFLSDSSSGNMSNIEKKNYILNVVPTKSQFKKVLIVSYFRSGSSWFGELLSMVGNTFYIYEPLHLTKVPLTEGEDELYSSYKLPRLEELFQCGISPRFITHLKKYGSLYKTPKCRPANCTAKEITDHCDKSDFIIIKTVRLLLSEVENLLIKPSLSDLKIILLIRDPRAVLNSLNRMMKKMKDRKQLLCLIIRQNIQSYQILKSIYPRNIFFVRYEDMARYPFDTALQVWKFIIEDEEVTEIPEELKQYLEKSIVKKGSNNIGSYQTNKKSTQDWQDWRRSISEELLKFGEEEDCDDVIKTLGYRSLGDIEKAKNFDYSVLEKDYCPEIPCK